jgi:ABC-type lipoprotein export system ATPase subunit
VTVVASTHDPTVAEHAGRVIRMRDGQIQPDAHELPDESDPPTPEGKDA